MSLTPQHVPGGFALPEPVRRLQPPDRPIAVRQSGRWRVAKVVCLLAALGHAAATPLAAQDDPPAEPSLPLVIINVASVERMINQAIVAFEAAERPELSETVSGALERVNDLQGLDRNQSMGVMIYLDGLTPTPVGYVPVTNLDDLLQTAQIGPVTTKRTGDDSFEIVTPERTIYARVRGQFAFLANDLAALDRDLRDPTPLTRRMAANYDVAASVNLASIPLTTRDLFLNIMRANVENSLQRRDDEPEAAHRMRKAAGMRNQELIEQFLTQGEQVIVGWSVSEAERRAALEIVLSAAPGTELAGYFNELKGDRSRFANLLGDRQPLSASLTWKLDRSARRMFLEMLAVVEEQLSKQLTAPAGDAAATVSPIRGIAQVLRETIDAGRLDAALQFVGQPPGAFVFVGGVRIAGAGAFSEDLRDILGRLKSNASSGVSDVQLGYLSYRGVTLHRVEFKNFDSGSERIYGGKPSLFLGPGDDVLWFALGGERATDELKRAIDRAAEPLTEAAGSSPFRFVMNFASWMDVFDPENRPEGFAARARSSFSKGGDALRVEANPIDDGVRLRITMDEAFLRLVGSQIARQIERREAEREEEAANDDQPAAE